MHKIAIFLTDLGGGGAERVMLNLANGFVNRGIEVDMLLVHPDGPYLSKLDPRINLISLNANRLISSIPELVKYLKKESPEVLLTALEDTNLTAIFAHRLSRLLGGVSTRMVVTVHNNLTQESKYLKTFKRRLVPYFIRWAYPFSDLVCAVSKGVAKDLQGLGIKAHKIRVVYNPIITHEFDKMAKALPDHPWFGIEDSPIFLGIGRLEYQKDFETLIKAYRLVKDQQPSRLMILGQGSQYQQLRALCQSLGLSEEEITFPGFVDNPLAYMSQASVCVLSSAWEGFGNVLVESMGVGTSVVSTDCPSGPDEILENGKYGTLVPVGNAEAMAIAILGTLRNPKPKSMLRKRAKDFGIEKILDEYQKNLFP